MTSRTVNQLAATVVIGAGALGACRDAAGRGHESVANRAAASTPAPRFELATVDKVGVPSVVKLPGRFAALQEVSIFPKVNGYVTQVLVDIGSKVPAGALLMVLEAPELEQAALQAKERFARATADYSIDREHLARLTEAARTAGAVSPLDLSSLRSKLEADSAVNNAERANWEMQQTMLSYLRVTAPFAGMITERNVHPGALVSIASHDRPMLDLKQEDHLRLQVDVPEEIAAQLRPRDSVSFLVSAFPGRRMTGYLDRRSNNIKPDIRAERTEVDVDNRGGELSPGMYADVLLYTRGSTTAFSVPAGALVTSTERKYVLAVRNGQVVMIDVLTGNLANGRLEVYGPLRSGEQVIANATAEIQQGTKVQ
jgi:membrane fusion protein (multidrug efflux system)